MILELDPHHPSPYHVDRIAQFLTSDGVIAMPTDTSYALACLPDHKVAVQKLIALRRLDPKKPLALVFRDIRQVSEYALVDEVAYRTLKRHLPGPYCFILESKRTLPRFIGDKRKRVGVRIPDHGVPQAIIDAVRRPLIVTTAADPETEIIGNDPWTVESFFGHGLAAVIDAGDVPGGVSTVVDMTSDEPELLRDGLGPADAFR